MISHMRSSRAVASQISRHHAPPPTTSTRVLLLGQYFYPEISGTAQVLTELARALRADGMQVSVLTAQPTYQRRRWLPTREVLDGIQIVRLPVPYLGRRFLIARGVSAALYAALALGWLLVSGGSGVTLIVTNPPFLPWLGWIARKARGQRYVCLVQDLYPDILARLGVLKERGILARMWEWLNVRVYRDAGAIVVLGERMAARLRLKPGSGQVRTRLEVIHNWADPDLITPDREDGNWFRRAYGLADKFVVLYSGNLGLVHDVETLLEAADLLRHDERFAFVFIGGGGKARIVAEFLRSRGLRNVQLLPYQPRERLPEAVTCGDIAAVTLAKGMEGLCVPGRFYTALAAGRAILAIVSRDCEVAELVHHYHCGIRVDQGDARGVVEALQRWWEDRPLLHQMQRNARRCFEERFTLGQAAQQYAELLRSVAAT